MDQVLSSFSPPVREWFASAFGEPTPPQAQGWPSIRQGDHTLILAPTGSGKTLAAFLWSLDRLVTEPTPDDASRRTRVLYISPLRALAFDVEKNLRAPLAGIRLAAERLGVPFTAPTVAMRTGDTPAKERQALLRRPPDLLITTPESLYLMLTSSARETLRGVEVVIVDEIHALAATKRGAHLALSLERLDALTDRPVQRIGLSATQRPLDEIARYLGGVDRQRGPRPVTIVDAGVRKPLEIEVVVPVDDMGDLSTVADTAAEPDGTAPPPGRSIWPAIHPRILDLVLAHRSTLIFCNARRLAERLAARLNELAELRGVVEPGHELVKAHHGSLAREQRIVIEDQLKAGNLRGLVATSSLELGIDMGAVDLVIQVESPGAVSRGLQRIGRAGHRVGEASRGTLFPKHRGDLLEAAVVVRRMREGLIEQTRYLRNPLDVLAQQIVAMLAVEDLSVDELAALVRGAAPFADLTDDVLESVLDLLAGRYPSEEFGELRPRIVWDRVTGRLRARDGAKRLAVTSGGTIPDRGLFGVFLPDGTRVGELDEEMVYESRVGEVFLLGATSWRIEEITFERVIVTPAPGQPGKMPFWHGDKPGRPLELGQAVGAFIRETRELSPAEATERLQTDYGLDPLAATNLLRYLDEQAESTGAIPDDRTIVIERFRDEIGDWRVCVLTPFGAQVHAPWAMAVQARLQSTRAITVESLWSDDGIVFRLPDADEALSIDDVVLDPETLEDVVLSALPSTSLFASRFRECAARALLLPRRRPDRRTPLWQQRQRAADLLGVAAKYPSFPILLETSRECLHDVFDVPALRQLLTDIRARKVRVVDVETPKASPFAQSLLFGWIAAYMYEGDAPLAERRAAALALDRDLLRELLGAEELRDLIDAGVLADLELELQRLVERRAARSADELHDLLRWVGDLDTEELRARAVPDAPVEAWIDELVASRRAMRVRVAGTERVAAAEDAARLRDALGVAIPLGLPAAFTEPVEHPLEALVARYARTHGPFSASAVAQRLGVPVARVAGALETLAGEGRVVHGEFRPGGVEREWVDTEVLRTLRRRSLAALRREVEPVEPVVLARFLPLWHHIGEQRAGLDALAEAIGVLQGAALVASSLETEILPARVRTYRPADLDALCTAGEVVWIGAGASGARDGRVRLYFRDQVALLAPPPTAEPPTGALHDEIRALLERRGACFWTDLLAVGAGGRATETELLAALWDLVWAGEVTNDSLAPLRAVVAGQLNRPGPPRGRARPGRLRVLGPPAGAGRWSLVAPLREPAPSPTARLHAQAQQLLERHGIVTREAVLAEGVEGGFSAMYPVFRALEERGQVRRGYFVAGLGAAQFALTGAVDRLRTLRDGADAGALVLAATDPAQPYGAALAWPESTGRPARAAGALVVLVDGEAAAYVDRSGHGLLTFPAARGDDRRWLDALVALVKDGHVRLLDIRRIDGAPAVESPLAPALLAAGFVDGYRGLTLRG